MKPLPPIVSQAEWQAAQERMLEKECVATRTDFLEKTRCAF